MASSDKDDEGCFLSCSEKLDRSSPDLWPEKIPGVNEFAILNQDLDDKTVPKWSQELDQDDLSLLQELGSLTTANLLDEVKRLQNLAYQLGLDEAKEMTRGKYLSILQKRKRKL